MKQNKAGIQPFLKLSILCIQRFFMDTIGLLNPACERNHYTFVIVDQFSNYIVTVPTPKINAHSAVNSSIHHCISQFGQFQYLNTDRRTESPNSEPANCRTLFIFRHSPRTLDVPWTIGLVHVQTKNRGTHLRMFLIDTPENWSIPVRFLAYAHNTQPLSHMHI